MVLAVTPGSSARVPSHPNYATVALSLCLFLRDRIIVAMCAPVAPPCIRKVRCPSPGAPCIVPFCRIKLLCGLFQYLYILIRDRGDMDHLITRKPAVELAPETFVLDVIDRVAFLIGIDSEYTGLFATQIRLQRGDRVKLRSQKEHRVEHFVIKCEALRVHFEGLRDAGQHAGRRLRPGLHWFLF